MPTPIREQINAAIKALVVGELPNDYVERNRRNPIPAEWAEITPGEPPRYIVINDGPHKVSQDAFGAKTLEMPVHIHGFVRPDTEGDIGSAMSGLYAEVLSPLLADPTLSGLCVDLKEDAMTPYLDPDSGQPTGGFLLEVVVEYQVNPSNPYLQGP